MKPEDVTDKQKSSFLLEVATTTSIPAGVDFARLIAAAHNATGAVVLTEEEREAIDAARSSHGEGMNDETQYRIAAIQKDCDVLLGLLKRTEVSGET